MQLNGSVVTVVERWLSVAVGFFSVPQQTPSSPTRTAPVTVTWPPTFAVVAVISVAA